MNLIIKSQSMKGLFTKALFFLILLASFSACKEKEYQNPYYQTPEQREAQKLTDEKVIRKYFRDNNVDTTQVVRTNSGLYYLQKKQGQGDLVKAGQRVDVHYIGKNIYNQTFDSSYPRGQAFSFVVGATPLEVIAGWDEGLRLMRKGEEAQLFIPSYLAYGYYGSGSIPPNSVLVFSIEVLNVR